MRWDAALYLLPLLFFSLANLCSGFVESRGCNRTLRNSVGWIRWTGRMGKCVVRIRAPLRDPQVIEVKVRRLQVGLLKETRCEGAYVQFSNDFDEFGDESGRYCGHITGNATRLFLRRGPDLTIVMDSEAKFAAENAVIFSAQFSILPARLAEERHRGFSSSASTECPLECTVRNERRSCRLASPGYPGVYPRGVRCRIALESSIGRFKIGGQPEDLFDLMNYTSQNECRTENCADRLKSSEYLWEPFKSQVRRRRAALREAGNEFAVLQATRKNKRKSKDTGKIDGPRRRLRHRERIQKKSMGKIVGIRGSTDRVLRDRSELWFNPEKDSDRKNFGIERLAIPQAPEYGHLKRHRIQEKLGSLTCVGDYLALLESVNGKVLEISKFCGEDHVPRILSRGKNVIIEFFAEKDGTVSHDGFQLTLEETEVARNKGSLVPDKSCEFIYKSTERNREGIKSLQSWYPPNTLCSYKFIGKPGEKISIHMKIIRNEPEYENSDGRRNFTLNYCPGNEIAVYNGGQVNDSTLMWSYCDVSHRDINNIQIPLTSSGKELLIQYYSAGGSYDGQDFTYTISYRFIRKAQNSTVRRQVQDHFKLISLRPVNFSALNLNDSENCNCDFGERIGSFKNWFVVLVVLGILSFLGAILTVVALLAKCLKMRSMERKLLQTPKR